MPLQLLGWLWTDHNLFYLSSETHFTFGLRYLSLISTNKSSPFTGGSKPPAGMDVSAGGQRGIRSPGRGTSLRSKRKSKIARNMYTSLLARNLPGQCCFAPPNGLQLVLRSSVLLFMKRRASKVSALDPKTSASMCSCLYGIRSLRPGCKTLPPIVTGSATNRIPTGLQKPAELVLHTFDTCWVRRLCTRCLFLAFPRRKMPTVGSSPGDTPC